MPGQFQRFLALSAALFVLVLAGCGSFFLSQPTPGQTPRFAYVANFSGGGAGTISAYTVALNGQLNALGNFATGPGPSAVRSDAAGQFVYTSNSDGTISAFGINRSTGALVPLAGTFNSGGTPVFLTVDPGAHSMYVANQNASLAGFAITAATGAPVALATAATTGPPVRLNFDPSGRFVHVAEGAAGADVFAATANGALFLQNVPAPAGASFTDILAEPRDRFVYVADGVSGVLAYTLNNVNGNLTAIPGGFFAAGNAPVALAVAPSGLLLFVANAGSQDVTTFAIDINTGQLTSLGSTPAGSTPADLAVDPSGNFLYVAEYSVGIQAFSISGGGLSPMGTMAAGQSPVSIAVTP